MKIVARGIIEKDNKIFILDPPVRPNKKTELVFLFGFFSSISK